MKTIGLMGLIGLMLVGCDEKPVALEIQQDELWKNEQFPQVRGKIHNPRKTAARNVTVSYELSVTNVQTNQQGKAGTATAEIRYVPPGATLDFTAVGRYRMKKWDGIEKSEGLIVERE